MKENWFFGCAHHGASLAEGCWIVQAISGDFGISQADKAWKMRLLFGKDVAT